MGVKVKKIRGSWYIVINYHGQRKTKKVGSSLAIARDVARKVEAKLALGDMGVFGSAESTALLFSEYAERWLQQHIEIRRKPATLEMYRYLMAGHILPQFGLKRVDAITPANVEDFVFILATKRDASGKSTLSQKTVSLIIGVLRSFFGYCKRTGTITSNPASCMGELTKSDKPARAVESMTRKESEAFLGALLETAPERYPLFLTALRTGMRRGELLALKWGDIAFGTSSEDPDRYIMVQRSYSHGQFGTTKSGRARRVDMSRQLRGVLLELREARLLAGMQRGKDSISDELIFPDANGAPLNPQSIATRFMEPALAQAGLRRFTPHCLRHTFAVLALQSGAPLKYVSEQLGHASIVITANTYGHLQPGANVHLVDRLDSTPATNANQAQTRENREAMESRQAIERLTVIPDSSKPDALIAY